MINKADIQSIIDSYKQDYSFLAEQDKLYFDSSSKSENESRESELSLIDGFISVLMGLIND